MSRCQWGIRDPRTLAPAFNGASVWGCDTPGTHRKICQPCPCNTQNCVYAGLLFTRRGQGRSDARCAQAPGSPAVPMEGLLFSIHLHRTRIVVVAARLEQRSGQSRPGAAESIAGAAARILLAQPPPHIPPPRTRSLTTWSKSLQSIEVLNR